jgi:phosphatidylethanolamine/phosphatidyl-N-methylethanolamine N-methyltransferase
MHGEEMMFDNDAFDYVVLSHVLAVTPNTEKLLAEAYRVLKPNGYLFILNHDTPENWLGQLDRRFSRIAGLLKFSSHFNVRKLDTLSSFDLVDWESVAFHHYFKLFTFRK